MKIVYFSGPQYTAPVLLALKNADFDVALTVTSQDKLKDTYLFDQFKQLQPDLCIVAAYGKIIPKKYLDVPKYGFINIHPSLLPKYRGPSPIKTAILNRDKETGVTIILIDEEMDHGEIISSIKYEVLRDKSYKDIERDLWDLGSKLLIEVLPQYISERIKPQEQDHAQATYTKKFNREDGRIDWSEPAEKIYNKIRALSDEPGAWTTWKGKILNIRQTACLEVELPNNEVQPLGTIINVDSQIAVATGKCYLILKTIQLEGGKEMDAKSFVNGHSDFLGSKLK